MNSANGKMTCRARLIMCSADLPARAAVLNMKQYNGQHGCSQCEDEGQPRTSSHLHRNWPFCASSTPWTHNSIMSNVQDCVRVKKPVSLSFHLGIINSNSIMSVCIHRLGYGYKRSKRAVCAQAF